MTDVRPDFCQHRQLRALCRECIDPVRPPETDEEPWSPADPSLPAPRTWSMFGLEDLAGWWAVVTAAVIAALLAVLLLLGLRAVRHPGGSR